MVAMVMTSSGVVKMMMNVMEIAAMVMILFMVKKEMICSTEKAEMTLSVVV